MDKSDSTIMYLLEDKNVIRKINNVLMFIYYFLLVVVVYQFLNREKEQRKYIHFFIIFLMLFFPLLFSGFQQVLYSIGKYIFLMFYKNIYVLDY